MANLKNLLIIDDEEDLRETLEYKFKAEGYRVETAFDGLDGLEKLKTYNPDLIILDMNMPRMNGLEFYQAITDEKEKPKHPVLVLTARANMEKLFTDLDVDGFMPKPFELEEVFKEAESIIKKYSGTTQKVRGSEELRARRVCIVENDPKAFNDLAVAFLESGYIVNSAQSGASAIKRMTMDVPDVSIISLGLKDISGDIVIGKLKRIETTKDVNFILYSSKILDYDKMIINQKISDKEGICQFIQSNSASDLLKAVDSLFVEIV